MSHQNVRISMAARDKKPVILGKIKKITTHKTSNSSNESGDLNFDILLPFCTVNSVLFSLLLISLNEIRFKINFGFALHLANLKKCARMNSHKIIRKRTTIMSNMICNTVIVIMISV